MNTGDRIDNDQYIALILSREELAKYSNDMFDLPIDPNQPQDYDIWRTLSIKVGTSLWCYNYAEVYPEEYIYKPEEEKT